MDIKEKQARWAKEKPLFEAEFIHSHLLPFFNFNENTGDYEIKVESLPNTDDEDRKVAYESLNTGWAMWLRAKRDAKAQAVPEWIDVSDHMPKEGEEVLVHHYGHIAQATKDKKYSGGFKQRNCRGWESVSCYISHWMSMSIKLPESYHFYYEHDAKVAKEKAMIEAREQKG